MPHANSLLAFLLLSALGGGVAHAEVLAVCGASAGHGYYLPGTLVSKDDVGWHEDAVTGGSFQLIRSGDEYDIIFTDAAGGTLSAKGDGAKTIGIVGANGDLIVTLFYPRAIETYAFWFGASGQLVATYSQVKHSARISKHALYKADCRKL